MALDTQVSACDGSWLLEKGGTQQPKKRRNWRRSQKGLQSFLSHVDSNDGAKLELKSWLGRPQATNGLQRTGDAENCRTSSHDKRTIAYAASLSYPTSHPNSEPNSSSEAPLQASPYRLTTLLETTPHPGPSTPRAGVHETVDKHQAMAIAPHLRREGAESGTSVSAVVPTSNKHSAASLRHSSRPRGANEDLASNFASLGIKLAEPTQSFNCSSYSLKNESIDSSLPNPESLAPSEGPVYQGRGQSGMRGRSRGGGRNGRGGRGGRSGTHGSRPGTGFCKRSEVYKGDPERWETDWEGRHLASPAGIGLSASFHAGGAVGSKWEQHSWSSPNSNAQCRDSAEWTLQDWDGALAPAPANWDSRPAFRKGQNEQQIQTWLDLMEGVAMQGVRRQPNLDDLPVVDGCTYTFGSPRDPVEGTKYVAMGDIVPHYWVRKHFYGGLALSTFFEDNVRSISPPPVDCEDLVGAKPWWETIVGGGSFLEECNTHDHGGIDPDEGVEEKLRRQSDFGSQHAAENKRRYELAKRGLNVDRVKRRAEKEARKAAMRQTRGGFTPDNLRPIHHSGKDLFLRHALSDDMEAVRDIYNYYVDFTASVPETQRLTVMELRTQFADITQRSTLPYLVAYEKDQVVKGRRKKGYHMEEPVQLPDTVVGFVRGREYGSGADSFRFTVNVDIFVHKDHLMKGIAKCLMDKMLALLDPDHIEQGGYCVYGDDLDAAKPNRKVKKIVANFLYPTQKPERVQQMSRWLVGGLGFKEEGRYEKIGTKLSMPLSKAVFVRTTGAVLDHANPPEVPVQQRSNGD